MLLYKEVFVMQKKGTSIHIKIKDRRFKCKIADHRAGLIIFGTLLYITILMLTAINDMYIRTLNSLFFEIIY